jgi:hypothetical protein
LAEESAGSTIGSGEVAKAPADGYTLLLASQTNAISASLYPRLPFNPIEDFVGINSVEHFLGEWAIENKLGFPKPEVKTGKKVAVIGGGPAGLSAAYQLAKKGHEVTLWLRDLVQTATLLSDLDAPRLQAPVWLHRTVGVPEVQVSLAEILLAEAA